MTKYMSRAEIIHSLTIHPLMAILPLRVADRLHYWCEGRHFGFEITPVMWAEFKAKQEAVHYTLRQQLRIRWHNAVQHPLMTLMPLDKAKAYHRRKVKSL